MLEASSTLQSISSIQTATMQLTVNLVCELECLSKQTNRSSDHSQAYLLYAASVVMSAPLEKRGGTSYSGGSTANDIENGGRCCHLSDLS
jgi:hypothetical protein